MGIDKADVRFVIHHTLPMSLNGYYQETGRAGRDGQPADCILCMYPSCYPLIYLILIHCIDYNYGDTAGMYKLIDDGDKDGRRTTPEEKERQKEDIRRVVQYCMNESDCRRVQVLRYFGENFNPAMCHRSCDNCVDNVNSAPEDVTDYAIDILNLVDNLYQTDKRATMAQSIDIFRGSNTKAMRERGFDQLRLFGRGKAIERGQLTRIFHHLLGENALCEEMVQNSAGWTNAYLKVR
jgi:superfamily II DNA helicase RecQ